MCIAGNLAQIRENIIIAKNKANKIQLHGNEPVKLVAVTKNHNVQAMEEAIAAGILSVGENRVQEALGKAAELTTAVEWQLIGHLQSNKVRQAVSLFHMIQSVDSQALALEINRVAGKLGKRQDILLQINVAKEESKYGIAAQDLMALGRFISSLEHVRLCGIMTIAPFYEQAEQARPVFREMYQLFMELKAANLENTKIEWLSMGMTNDYMVAVEEGSNLVRIGTGIFGQRDY